MTHEQLLALIDEKAAADPVLADDVAERRDALVAAALSVGRTRVRPRLITERGVISGLGPIEGEALLQGLEGFASSVLPPEHPLAAYHAGIKRIIGWLKPPSEGVDIGDPLTANLLGTLAALNTPGITTGRVSALLAMAHEPDPIDVKSVSDALNRREKEQQA